MLPERELKNSLNDRRSFLKFWPLLLSSPRSPREVLRAPLRLLQGNLPPPMFIPALGSGH